MFPIIISNKTFFTFALNPEVKQFLGFPYNYARGPWLENKDETARDGLNCQLFVHFIYKKWFGVVLPKGMWGKEIYEDHRILFRSVAVDEEELKKGDIFLFGPKQLVDARRLHLAVYTGEMDEDKDLLLLHVNSIDQISSLWPLRKFHQYRRYKILHRVKRLTPELFNLFIRPQR